MDVAQELLEVVTALLGANLVGVYTYERESGTPHPIGTLLIVTARDLLRDRKYGLTQAFLRHSSEAVPLEALVVREADLQTEQPSVLVQLHFAEQNRSTLAAEVGGIAWLKWPDGLTGSVDRGELLNSVQRAGRTLAGRSVAEILDVMSMSAEPAPTQPPSETRRQRRTPRQLPFE